MEDRALRALPALGAAVATVRNLLDPAVIGRVPDDAFFYLVIARNLAAGRGFTFDGREVTTGFHPLWLALVRVLPSSTPEAGFAGLLVLHGLLTAASATLVATILRREGAGPRHAGLLGALVGAWGASAYGIGMEAALVTAALLAVLTRAGAFAGFVAGLARPDVVPALGGVRPSVAIAGLLGALLPLGFNRVVSGEWVSTSVALKGLGTVAWRVGRLDPAVVWRHLPGPAVAAAVVILLMLVRRRPLGPTAPMAGLAALTLVAEYGLDDLVGPWYHLPLTWLLVVSAGRSRIGALIVGIALLRGVPLPSRTLHSTVREFAQEVVHGTPADSRLIAEDFPGILAWYGQRDVLPADGLAASPAYRPALLAGEGITWWRDRGATHWLVTRRRAPWLEARPLVDRLAPPFLPVPEATITLEPESLTGSRVDPDSDRLFAVFELE